MLSNTCCVNLLNYKYYAPHPIKKMYYAPLKQKKIMYYAPLCSCPKLIEETTILLIWTITCALHRFNIFPNKNEIRETCMMI